MREMWCGESFLPPVVRSLRFPLPPSGDSASSTFEHAAINAGGGRGTAASLLTISNSIKEFGKTAEAWQVGGGGHKCGGGVSLNSGRNEVWGGWVYL